MRAYSQDLRERVVAAAVSGKYTQEEVAARFEVGLTFIKKMVRLYRNQESLAPRRVGGGPQPRLGDREHDVIREVVAKTPDITLEALQQILIERLGNHASVPTIWRAVKRLGLRRKKRR